MPLISRRRLVTAFAASVVIAKVPLAHALPALTELEPIVRDITGGAPLREGRVTLEIPHLSDNGHAVPLKVSVASAMSESDYVRTVHLLSQKNPRPIMAVFHFRPECGRAEIFTRVRVNGAQNLLAIATMSDGSYWAASSEVIVTETACLDAS
jgi:sulfur-oxidizing protein SoxY